MVFTQRPFCLHSFSNRFSDIRAFSDITHDEFASEETALARFDQRTHQHASEMQTDTLPTQTEIPSDLAAYFDEHMRQADSPAEMDSVRRLRDAVTSQRVQDKQQPLRILQ